MAVYVTLAIECGRSFADAEHIAAFFRDLELTLPGMDPVPCRVFVGKNAEGFWMATVWPEGLGHACLPITRDELISPAVTDRIEEELFIHLRQVRGYRAALFGYEAQDALALSATPTEAELTLGGLVYAESLVTWPSPLRAQPLFAPGYRRMAE